MTLTSEYDGLAGYLVDEYTHVWQDASGRVWRTVAQVINLGKPVRDVRPLPDAITQCEPLPVVRLPHGVLRDQVRAYLIEYGPSTTGQIAAHFDRSQPGIWDVLQNGALFCITGYVKEARRMPRPVYGVVGVHDADA